MKNFYKLFLITLFAISVVACSTEEEPAEPVEQEEAQKKATADFQEREKKVAEEIATKPETAIGDLNPEPKEI